MSNRSLSLAVAVLLVLGVLTSAAVVMQNRQLLTLADSVARISSQAEHTFTLIEKQAAIRNNLTRTQQ